MSVRFNHNKHYKSESIVSDEDKLARLQVLLGNKLASHGRIFTPDESFYSLPLFQMAEHMLDFIGVKLGKDVVYVSFDNTIKDPGIYFEHDGTHYILIKKEYQNNRYASAAILAHELMHYILLGGLNFRLEGKLDNEQLTDMATVYTGLGLVVLNGFAYEGNNWAITAILLLIGVIHVSSSSKSFGYYKAEQYAQLFSDYIHSYKIPYAAFSGYVLPGAVHFLPSVLKAEVRRSEDKTELVRRIESARRRKAIISAAIAVPIVIFLIVISTQNSNSTANSNGMSAQSQQLQDTANSLKSQYSTCENLLSVLQTNLNQTNSQMDNYKSEGDIADYNSLVDKQNREVTIVQNKQSQCDGLYTQANNAVDAYNSSLNQ